MISAVAMTRAQSLLIVIGDPIVLSLDPLWRSFLNYIFNNGSWKGSPRPDWDTNGDVDNAALIKRRKTDVEMEYEDMMQRITHLVDQRAREEDLEDVAAEEGYEFVERPWREAE